MSDSSNDAINENMTLFKNSCMCGGYAHSMNGRNPRSPHMDWCPQREEYNEWYDKMYQQMENKNE